MYDKKTLICVVILSILSFISINILLKIINKDKYEKLTNSSGTNSSGTNSSGTNWLSDEELEELAEECNWSCGRIRTDFSTNGKAECYPDKNGKYESYQECINTGCESHVNDCVLNNSTEWVESCLPISNKENCNNSYYYENNMNKNNINLNPQRCRWNEEEEICTESNNGTDILYNKCNLPKCQKYYKPLDESNMSENINYTSCINNDQDEECGKIIISDDEIIKFSGINKDNYLVNCNIDDRQYGNNNLNESELILKTMNNNENICEDDTKDINPQICEPIECEIGLEITENCSDITADKCENYGEKFSIGTTQVSVYEKRRINENGNIITEWDTMENNYIVPCRLASTNDSLNQCMGKVPDENGLIPICQMPNKCKNKDCGQNGIGISRSGGGSQRGYCDNNTGECICDTASGYSGENCELMLGKPDSKCVPEGGVCAVYDNEGSVKGRWWDTTDGWGCCKSGDVGPNNDLDTSAIYGKNITFDYEAYELGVKYNSGQTRNYLIDPDPETYDQIIYRPSKNFKGNTFWMNDDIYASRTSVIAIPKTAINTLESKNPEELPNPERLNYIENNYDIYKEYVDGKPEDFEFIGWGDSFGLGKKLKERDIVPKEALFCRHNDVRDENGNKRKQYRTCEKCSNMTVNDTPYSSLAKTSDEKQRMLNWAINECSATFPRERQSIWPDPGLGRTPYDSYQLCVKNGDPISRCTVNPGGDWNGNEITVGACQAATGNNKNLGSNIKDQGAIKLYDNGCRSR
jgi:hypothetical protein